LSLATCSVIALIGGLAAGMLGHGSGAAGFRVVERLVTPIGDLWLVALQMLLLPLLVSQLLAAITSAEGGGRLGRLGLQALLMFVGMLVAAGALTYAVSKPLVSLYHAGPGLVSPAAAAPAVAPAPAKQSGAAELPTNLVEAARKGMILPLLVFAALLGAAVLCLPQEGRAPLTAVFRGFADAMLIVVRWVLIFTPLGVFALTYAAALHAGGVVAGMIGAFLVLVCSLLVLFILLLYPITAVAAKISMRTFAKAAAPAQLVAVSTLSSIAALPALIQGGSEHLRLPRPFTGFLLPLSVSVFKINRTISATAKLVFVAHVYGIPLSPLTVVVFIATVTLLRFSTPGVPNGGQTFSTLPAYLAAGLPAQAVILLEATSMAQDMIKTVLNVTGDMSVAAILSRSSRETEEVAAPAGVAGALSGEGLP
jgi:proton glutamate symport protein